MTEHASPPAEPAPPRKLLKRAMRQARRVIVLVVGGTVLLFGVVLLVTPGPAFVFIPAGLAILATEFVWARRLLERVRTQVKDMAGKISGNGSTIEIFDSSIPWYRRYFRMSWKNGSVATAAASAPADVANRDSAARET